MSDCVTCGNGCCKWYDQDDENWYLFGGDWGGGEGEPPVYCYRTGERLSTKNRQPVVEPRADADGLSAAVARIAREVVADAFGLWDVIAAEEDTWYDSSTESRFTKVARRLREDALGGGDRGK